MSTLGFEEYVEPLKLYLHKYREVLRGFLLLCISMQTLSRLVACWPVIDRSKGLRAGSRKLQCVVSADVRGGPMAACCIRRGRSRHWQSRTRGRIKGRLGAGEAQQLGRRMPLSVM